MTSPESGRASEYRNNFDLIRFLLAGSVILFHLAVLPVDLDLTALHHLANGTYGVLGFFSLSGYVVTLSWYRSATVREFAGKRLRRVLPGYIAVVVFWWLAGAAISRLPASDYWRDAVVWRYLAANLSFLQFLAPDLPGVFGSHSRLTAVNGSLWSIRSELFCYLMLVFSIRWRSASGVFALLFGLAGIALAQVGGTDPGLEQLRRGLANPFACFFAGVWLAQTKSRVTRAQLAWAGIVGLSVLIGGSALPDRAMLGPVWQGLVMPLGVAAAVLGAGLAVPWLGNWPLVGNLSYGMYLWNFPVIQFALSRNWFHSSALLFAVACFALTLVAALLSWFCVERSFLIRFRYSVKQVS